MSFTQYQRVMRDCLAEIERLLGGSARPVSLTWDMEQLLRTLLLRRSRHGLGAGPPLVQFHEGSRGHRVEVGLQRYSLDAEGEKLSVVRAVLPCVAGIEDFWAVRREDYVALFRALRRALRKRTATGHHAPVMPEAERRRLWENSIGLLTRARRTLDRYGVAIKRGILLTGSPGNGKTMACRWLQAECARHRLAWRNVTLDDYENARQHHCVPALFESDEPGVVLFDDFDAALRDRAGGGASEHTVFLTALDGVRQPTNVVYLFASNLTPAELDPAVRRPGRIDVILPFDKPDADRRRALIERFWHDDIRAGIDVEQIVGDTRGMSFAEIEEAKKLLVLRHLDTGRWDWPHVLPRLRARLEAEPARRRIGFNARNGANGAAVSS
jgi:hypothetical protein